MKRVFILLSIAFLLGLTSQGQVNIIVKIKPEISYQIDYGKNTLVTSNAVLAAAMNDAHVQKITSLVYKKMPENIQRIDLVKNIHIFQVDALKQDEIIGSLLKTGLFMYVEKDQQASGSGVAGITPNDTYYNNQWAYVNNGTFNASAKINADVDMDMAWTITTGSNTTILCTLDTGLKLDHPEVAGRLWVNNGEIPNNNIDDDLNGFVDDVNGWDWVNTDKDPTDDYGHGTNVTGIIGASGNNGIGYAGVNWNCKLMTGKVLNASNSGSYSWMVSGITYAVLEGANIINMSIGGSGFSQSLSDVCDFAKVNNVAIFACMMNFNNNTPYYPAAFSSTIAVGATDVNDYRVQPFFWSTTSGSNYGTHIDLVAPGNYIYGLSYTSNTNYGSYWGGTSQATPLVAGVASLIHALKPNVTVEELRTILRTTAKDLVGRPGEDVVGWDQYMGAGRMNAYNALVYTQQLLPIKLNKLTAITDKGKILLQWTTEQEVNSSHFEIERSDDLIKWIALGKIDAKGNTSIESKYSFIDSKPYEGYNYYRLKQFDKDGKFEYSNVVKAWNAALPITVKAISPFTNNLRLMINASENKMLRINVYSSLGTLIKQVQKLSGTGSSNFDMDASAFARGSYQVLVSDGEEKIALLKVVK